jgi:hypothetical protein
MKSIIVIFLICTIPIGLFAQLDSFNLASYKLADIKTHRLDFNLSGTESGTSNWSKSADGVKSKYNDFNYTGDVSARYSFIRNSEKYQGELNAEFRSTVIKYNDYFGKHFSINPSLSINSINRNYIKTKRFLEYDLNLYGNLISKADTGTDGLAKGNNSLYLTVEIPLLIGTGRIDPVQDARLAVYILQDLQKISGLSRIPDQVEILEFARLISQTKSKRFFDSRDKLIWEMETIDKFLKSKNILKGTDAAYFTRLYDNWLYSYGPVRESGRRFSAGLVPMLTTTNHYEYYSDSIVRYPVQNSPILKAVIRQEQTKPVSLYWQTGHLFELAGIFVQDNENPIIKPTSEDPINVMVTGLIKYNLGWYPSSRTSVTMNTGIDADIYSVIPKGTHGLTYDLNPSLGMNFRYYFSPQLQLYVNYEVLYSFSSQRWEIPLYPFHQFNLHQGLNHSFNLNLFYSLF